MSFKEPSQDSRVRLRQLRAITAAYKSLNSSEPTLPLSTSPLPALLALRTTLSNIDQFKRSINDTTNDIESAQTRLHQEEADLKDARALAKALDEQTLKLQAQNNETSQKSPEDLAEAMVQEQRHKARYYQLEMRKLVKALNLFVNQHLAVMIAAEDLGGPIVGEAVDIDRAVLKTGYNQHDRPKRSKRDKNSVEADRKRRNEELWNYNHDPHNGSVKDEKEAAGADFLSLTEDLLNAAAGEEDTDPYISIRRDSAAARFLVRARVAQFYPDDTNRLRLIEFDKELGD